MSEVRQLVRVGSLGPVTNLLVGGQGSRSLRFGPTDWSQVVAHAGDLSMLGIPIVTNSPVPGFELLRADWDQRMKRGP
jgi:hypothetical protein